MQFHLSRYILELEEIEKRQIPLTEIESKSGISYNTLDILNKSHFSPEGLIPLNDLVKLSNLLKVDFKISVGGIVIGEASIFQDNFKTSLLDDKENKTNKGKPPKKEYNIYKNSKCHSGNDFKYAMKGSSYYDKYNRIDGFINMVSDYLDSHHNIIAGVSQNFNLKTKTEDVIARFDIEEDIIVIKSKLLGRSVTSNEKDYFMKIYEMFLSEKGSNRIETSRDLKLLLKNIDEITKNYDL